jgi:hypothetical protein
VDAALEEADPDELGVGDGADTVGVGDARLGDGVGLADFDGGGCEIELGCDVGLELDVDGLGAGVLPLVSVGLGVGTGKMPWVGWPGNKDATGSAPRRPNAWP